MVKFLRDTKNNCIMQIDFKVSAVFAPGACFKTSELRWLDAENRASVT